MGRFIVFLFGEVSAYHNSLSVTVFAFCFTVLCLLHFTNKREKERDNNKHVYSQKMQKYKNTRNNNDAGGRKIKKIMIIIITVAIETAGTWNRTRWLLIWFKNWQADHSGHWGHQRDSILVSAPVQLLFNSSWSAKIILVVERHVWSYRDAGSCSCSFVCLSAIRYPIGSPYIVTILCHANDAPLLPLPWIPRTRVQVVARDTWFHIPEKFPLRGRICRKPSF